MDNEKFYGFQDGRPVEIVKPGADESGLLIGVDGPVTQDQFKQLIDYAKGDFGSQLPHLVHPDPVAEPEGELEEAPPESDEEEGDSQR